MRALTISDTILAMELKGLPGVPFRLTVQFVLNNLSNTGRTRKQILSFAVDGIIVAFSIWAAYSLRLGEPYSNIANIGYLLVVLPPITVFIFASIGIYRWVVRASTSREFEQLFKGSLASAAVLLVFLYLIPSSFAPRSVFLIYCALLMILTISARVMWAKIQNTKAEKQGKPVAIYGAGVAGRQLVTLMRLSEEYHPEFFLDDSYSLIGSTIAGLPVYNPKRPNFHHILNKYAIEEIIMAMPSVEGEQYSRVLRNIQVHGAEIKTIPSVTDIVSGRNSPDEIRELKLEDLLGRTPIDADQTLMSKNIRNKTVLISGAGGSIGSELCRQVLGLKPKHIVLLDNSEIALYKIDQKLNELRAEGQTQLPIDACLGSVTDESRLAVIFAQYKPDTVYHAAAYKHVPMVENNPFEGVKTNLFGTKNLVEAAEKYHTETFVFISTDKAVRPTNVMGATKRLCEILINTYAEKSNQRTRFCMVRFGNVLGSSGSVIPRFQQQIVEGGPVTVTDKEMTRYFMTVSEAVSLVIQAGAMSHGGEVNLLDMGDPVKISELAKALIQLQGKRPLASWDGFSKAANPSEILITESGVRPGEKLYEELLIDTDTATPTAHKKIFQANESCQLDMQGLNEWLEQLLHVTQTVDKEKLIATLESFELGYTQLEG